MFPLLLIYSLGSLLLILLAIPLLLGKVKPNPFYGFRVQQTLDDSAAWYAVNAYFAKYQLAAGVIELLASVGLYFVPGISVDVYALSCLSVFVIVFGIGLTKGWMYLKNRSR